MIIYVIGYLVSFICAAKGRFCLSGAALLAAALYLYSYDYRRTANPIHLRALFSLFWVGGQGIACFKLSTLGRDWALETWACFFVALAGFWLVFEGLEKKGRRGGPNKGEIGNRKNIERKVIDKWTAIDNRRAIGGFRRDPIGLIFSMAAITVLSWAAFLLEAAVLGYVPFWVRGVPHAYSEFHITGVHYFTVSCVLVPSLAASYFCGRRAGIYRGSRIFDWAAAFMAVSSLLIPILCVSRFQLIFAVALAAFTYMGIQKHFSLVYGVVLVLFLIPLYVILTIARSHDIGYLNGIFQMKNQAMPIFITQPYMYIANNYENFDCLVKELPAHTHGLRMLFPLWALTGLKFKVPGLVDFPLYVNKEELTTVTLFYDAYYDFGFWGVLVFSGVLGAISQKMVCLLPKMKNPAGYLLYAQLGAYLMLSFFTTWFSNPATWFYFAATAAVAVVCWLTGGNGAERRHN